MGRPDEAAKPGTLHWGFLKENIQILLDFMGFNGVYIGIYRENMMI